MRRGLGDFSLHNLLRANQFCYFTWYISFCQDSISKDLPICLTTSLIKRLAWYFFLIFFCCFHHFLLESICFLLLFSRAASVHSTFICGWSCGQASGLQFSEDTAATQEMRCWIKETRKNFHIISAHFALFPLHAIWFPSLYKAAFSVCSTPLCG